MLMVDTSSTLACTAPAWLTRAAARPGTATPHNQHCCTSPLWHLHTQPKEGAAPQTRTLRSRRGELQTLLEACVENATRGPLFLEYLRFEPSSHLSAEELPREELGDPDPDLPLTALERYVDGLKVCCLPTMWWRSLAEAEAGSL